MDSKFWLITACFVLLAILDVLTYAFVRITWQHKAGQRDSSLGSGFVLLFHELRKRHQK